MIGIGDEVVCIFPGRGTGPDCFVGRRFVVRDIVKAHYFTGTALVFDVHLYTDKYGYHPSARACRFAKPDELDAVERSAHKIPVGVDQ